MNEITLRIDGGTQPRERLDEGTVERYREAMADGLWDFGRVSDAAVAFFDGTDHWLGDGFHRFEAAKRAGTLDAFAATLDVRQGTQRDAILYSVGANAHHGFVRSADDKRRAVSRLLADPEWAQWSDREIARRCCVTHPFVAKLRALTGNVSSDGEKIYTTRHGTTATMDTSRIGRAAPKPTATQRAETEAAALEQPARDRRAGALPEADDPQLKRNRIYRTFIKAMRAINAINPTSDLEELPGLVNDAKYFSELCCELGGAPDLLVLKAEIAMARLQDVITRLKKVLDEGAAARPTHEGGAGTLH